MKIAFLIGYFPALSETFILNQIIGLLNRGHTVDIFAVTNKWESTTHSEILKYNLLSKTHYRYNIRDIFYTLMKPSIGKYKKLIKTLNFLKYGQNAYRLRLFLDSLHIIKNGPYDIVHSHFATKNIIGAQLKDTGTLKGGLISSFYGYDITGFIEKNGKDIYNILFNNASRIIIIVNQWKKKLIDLGCSSEKIIVNRIGVDPAKFKNDGGKIKPFIQILSIGRLVEKKGLEYGIRAFAKINKKNPNVIYKILGEGPLKRNLTILTEKLGLKEKVFFLGSKDQDEIIKIIKKSDILLAPSITAKNGDQEGTPVALMEAMAGGLPALSTYHGGIPELVKDEHTGFLVNEKDSNDLANKLEFLIQNPKVRKTFGRNGRKQIKDNFNTNLLNDNLIKIYEDVLWEKKIK
jgi:colanic acid/amylovoran biosynthesis glycosyltransferase